MAIILTITVFIVITAMLSTCHKQQDALIQSLLFITEIDVNILCLCVGR